MGCKVFVKFPHLQGNQIQDTTEHVRQVSVADIQLLLPAEHIVSPLLNDKAFERTFKFINHPNLMPNL